MQSIASDYVEWEGNFIALENEHHRPTSNVLVFNRKRQPRLFTGAHHECLEYALLPGCSAEKIADFVKESSASGDELSRALDLPSGGRFLAIDFCTEIEDWDEDFDCCIRMWVIVTDETSKRASEPASKRARKTASEPASEHDSDARKPASECASEHTIIYTCIDRVGRLW